MTSMASESVGLIGLGLVGSALAERFAASGFRVIGFDIDPEKMRGVEAAASPAEVGAKCRRVVLSLPESGVAREVLDALEVRPGTIIVDTTTGDPDQMAASGDRVAAAGAHYLDATIGGSSTLVRAGEAIVICGGDAETFGVCRDLFAAFSRQAFHMGACGAGARMKLVMNLVLGLNRAVLAEGLVYAAASGIGMAQALEVLKAGPAYSRAMDAKGRKMIEDEFSPEARLSQHLKDVRLILKTAAGNGAYVPLSKVHRDLLEKAETLGFGCADNSAVIKAFQGRTE